MASDEDHRASTLKGPATTENSRPRWQIKAVNANRENGQVSQLNSDPKTRTCVRGVLLTGGAVLSLAAGCTTQGHALRTSGDVEHAVTQTSPARFHRVWARHDGSDFVVRGRGRSAVLLSDHVHVEIKDSRGTALSTRRATCLPNARRGPRPFGLHFAARFPAAPPSDAAIQVTYHLDGTCRM